MIDVRVARESDAAAIRDIVLACYGEDYSYADFYDIRGLKKLIFSDDNLLLVAEDTTSGKVVGTASVLLEIGAYADLVAEFGRLAVHPDARDRGIGRLLLQRRIESVQDRLHVGLIEARIEHPYTQRIADTEGFAPVGFLPLKWQFARRESMVLLAKYFGHALELRRNHPRVIPEVYELAARAMENLDLQVDVVVDEDAMSYPPGRDFEIQELTTKAYPSLLRIPRGRVRHREIYGPLRLHYGVFQLEALHSRYLIAREDGNIVGAAGVIAEKHDRLIRVVELISLRDDVVPFLLRALIRRCREEWDMAYIEIDVSADAPRMQRSLLELGFVPAAYVPALVFHEVERLDIVKMVQLIEPLTEESVSLVSPSKEIADLVMKGFRQRKIVPRVAEVMYQIPLFAGLTAEQLERVARTCGYARVEPGTAIFREGDPSTEMYILLSGCVGIYVGNDERIGHVCMGECIGEVALLTGTRHSARAVADGTIEVAVMSDTDLKRLVRLRPNIGVVLYQNVARDLGAKLRRADQSRAQVSVETLSPQPPRARSTS